MSWVLSTVGTYTCRNRSSLRAKMITKLEDDATEYIFLSVLQLPVGSTRSHLVKKNPTEMKETACSIVPPLFQWLICCNAIHFISVLRTFRPGPHQTPLTPSLALSYSHLTLKATQVSFSKELCKQCNWPVVHDHVWITSLGFEQG